MRKILLVTLLISAAGCGNPTGVEASGISGKELETLVDPVAGASAADYRAKERTLRVFGVQGDPPFATVTDTRTWQTWNLHDGETLGRGLRARIEGATLVLANAESEVGRLSRGAGDVDARTIAHRLDEAAIYEGRSRWRVDAASIKEIEAAKGAGVEAVSRLDLFPVPAVELVTVAPDGALASLGLRAGDFLFELNGEPLDWQNLDALVDAASEPGTFTLSMYRAGSPGLQTFTVR